MKERLTSRKFLLAVLALLCLTALCAFDKIDGGQFITGLAATVGAYLATNYAQKKIEAAAATAKKTKADSLL